MTPVAALSALSSLLSLWVVWQRARTAGQPSHTTIVLPPVPPPRPPPPLLLPPASPPAPAPPFLPPTVPTTTTTPTPSMGSIPPDLTDVRLDLERRFGPPGPERNPGGRALAGWLSEPPVTGKPSYPFGLRDRQVLALVQRGWFRPVEFVPISCGPRGSLGAGAGTAGSDEELSCIVVVTRDAFAIGTANDAVRVTVSQPTAQIIADTLGMVMLTTRLSDLAYLQATTRLSQHTQGASSQMAFTSRVVTHSDAIDTELSTKPLPHGLVRPLGKDYVVTDRLLGNARKAAIYGWHGAFGGQVSANGVRMFQPLSTVHFAGFTDYSQLLCFAGRTCWVGGEVRDLEAVMRDPVLFRHVCDEPQPLRVTRHPAVPSPAPLPSLGVVA